MSDHNPMLYGVSGDGDIACPVTVMTDVVSMMRSLLPVDAHSWFKVNRPDVYRMLMQCDHDLFIAAGSGDPVLIMDYMRAWLLTNQKALGIFASKDAVIPLAPLSVVKVQARKGSHVHS